MCVLPVATRPFALFQDGVDCLLSRREIRDRHELRPAEVYAGRLNMPSTDKEVSLAELLRQTGDALLDRTVEVSNGGKVLHLWNDVALREQGQRLMDRRVDPLRAFQLHAFGPL